MFALGIPSLPEVLILTLVPFIIWIIALVSHLRRTDCSDADKITWTIVLCTLNILGVVLYWFLGPRGDDRVLSEQELKAKFNRQ